MAGTGETASSSSSVEVFPREADTTRSLLEATRVKRTNLEEQIAILEARAVRHKKAAEESAMLTAENSATLQKIATANNTLLLEQEMGLRMQKERQEALKGLRAKVAKQEASSCELAARRQELHDNHEELRAQYQVFGARVEAIANERMALECESQGQISQAAMTKVDAEFAAAESAQRNVAKAKREEAMVQAEFDAEHSLGHAARKATLEAECSSQLLELETCFAAEREEAAEINERVNATSLVVDNRKQGIECSDDLVREFDRRGQESLADENAANCKIDAHCKELAATNQRAESLQQRKNALRVRRDAWQQGTAAVFGILVVVAAALLMVKGAIPAAYE